MIMSIDFQFLYDNLIFFLKMKYASIILDVFHQISLLITSSFLSCSPFENDRKRINPPSFAQIFGAILRTFDWLFEVKL